ncbi:DUF1776-domain-containing protein [Hypoxylon trugodes]|uniref:DUF1776-domain-containing protein n=1 Tax=Hypoxylon trugodes TaxID=326681 RepID=UPI002199DB28|nr:DUF1776-domain-containing protein [Hypoxylon trugodes]KAI1392970.1 DUF1776-domain-containing protein [Hypoxylon trugodes]
MSADDQQFLDLLSSIPNHIRRYSEEVAGYVDKTVEKVADEVRDTLATAPWVPDYVRPTIPARPPPVVIVPITTYERVHDWISRNKLLTGIIVVSVGYASYKTWRATKLLRKTRRAKRARNGGRLEVVVIAGSPTLPLTKSLSLDMERRGFIVYVVCNTIEDEVTVQSLSRPDIKPLGIDITDPTAAGQSIERFAAFLQAPHAPVPRAKPNYLTLKAVILIPSLNYQTSPIATIPPSSFADLFNTHLLHPILTIQSFLPLLTSKITPYGEKSATPRVLVFTPSIISSINPPFHAPEATVCSALSAFTEVLTAELRPLSIPVTHIQLGTFDFTGFTPVRGPSPHTHSHNSVLLTANDTRQWPEAARHAYARNYVSQSGSAIAAGRIGGLRGSSLRDLHNAVFDVVDGTDLSDVVRVGLGAGIYGFVGRWAPRGLVAWMMGIRRVHELSSWEGSGSGNVSGSVSEGGSGSSENGEGSEFIAVARDDDGGHNVWKDGLR